MGLGRRKGGLPAAAGQEDGGEEGDQDRNNLDSSPVCLQCRLMDPKRAWSQWCEMKYVLPKLHPFICLSRAIHELAALLWPFERIQPTGVLVRRGPEKRARVSELSNASSTWRSG